MKTATHKEATAEYDKIIASGLYPCMEVDEAIVYFEPSAVGFQFGTVTNTGILQPTQFEYDNDFSIDENLQAMMEDMEAEYGELS